MASAPQAAPQAPPQRRRHPSLWWAFAFVLLLVGVLEWAVWRRQPAPPVPVQQGVLPAGAQVAIFAGGCFWSTEAVFDAVAGVLSTTTGYTGGKTANPTYPEVASHATGHAEAVRVVFDPQRVTYAQLLQRYWHSIDPTARNKQFCDHGTPYRSVIFASDDAQLQQALASRAALEQSKQFKEPIQTQIEPAQDFYPAEDEHQDFHQKNPQLYAQYRASCGREARLQALWGDLAQR